MPLLISPFVGILITGIAASFAARYVRQDRAIRRMRAQQARKKGGARP